MAGQPIGSATVLTCRDRRFKLEQLLALDLVYEITSHHDFIGPFRQMARAAIAEIQDLGAKNWQFQAAARQAFREERFLAIWKKTDRTPTGSRFKDIGTLSSDAHLSVFDIADIIRLYGAIVEFSAQTGLSYAKEWDKDKSSYRRGIGNEDKSTVWGKDINKGGRRLRDDPVARDPISGKAGNVKPPGGMAYYSGGTKSTATEGRGLRAWQVPDLHPPRRGGRMSPRGIDLKQATGKSTVRKIEDLFGLPVGADISGTTADQVYFINRFCERCEIQFDPIFYVFPLASLVRPRHHSLVEVALTLSSVDIINYHVGFYSTLLPENSKHASAARIGNVFKKWENHQWNNSILVYFKKDNRIDGGWHFGAPTSDKSYRRLSGVCDHFSDFVNLWKPPDYTQVLNLIRKHLVDAVT